MKSSTYLIWIRRLIVLGVVVAGTVASTAGAVGRPPDVQDAAAALHFTSAGLTADGLRLQGTAQVYKQLELAKNAPTPQGIKADGLRWQGIAQVYKQIQSVSVPDVFERYATAHPYGSGLSSVSLSTLVSRPPDVRDAASASQSTIVDRIIAQEQGRQADLGLFSLGLTSPTSSTLVSRPPDVSDAAQAARYGISFSQSSGFDWADYGIGIGSGIGLTLILAAGLGMSLQRRHRMQTV